MELAARKLLSHQPTDLWSKLVGRDHTVHFDDGTVKLSATEIILSSYGWCYNRTFPKVPLLRKNTIKNFYKAGVQNKSSHLEQLNYSLWEAVDYLNFSDDRVKINKLCKVMARVNNTLYNDSVLNTSEYVTGADVYDYIMLMRHPQLLALKKEVLAGDKSPASIAEGFMAGEKLLRIGLRNPDGKLNIVSWMAQRGLVKCNQVLQCVFMRGYVPDIDHNQIPHLIENCLLQGMVTYRDYATLSREGAVAAVSTMGDLRKSSIEARLLSYAGQNRHDVVKGDCGSTEYIHYTVSEPVYDEITGVLLVDSDLRVLKGTWYVNDKDEVTLINGDEKELYGKTIRRRSQLTCKHPDPHVACSTCYGRLAEGVPPGSNVGTDVSKATTHDTIQMTMAIKHVLNSIGAGGTARNAIFKTYLKMKANSILLKKISGAKKITMIIPMDQAKNLLDISSVEDVKNLTIARISCVNYVVFKVTRTKKHMEDKVDVADGKIGCNISYDLLDYIHKNMSVLTVTGDSYQIDITGFDASLPLFLQPIRLADMRAVASEITKLYGRTGDARKRNEFNIPSTLTMLVDKVNSGSGTINIAAIETILSGFISKVGTYKLAKGLKDTYHGRNYPTIQNRSLGTALIYEGQCAQFTNPRGYLTTDRTDSILDVYIDPAGVVDHYLKTNPDPRPPK